MNKFLLLLSVVVYVNCNGLIRSSIGSTTGYDGGYGSPLLYQQLYQQEQHQPQLYQQEQHQPQLYQQQQYQPQLYQSQLYKQQAPQIVEVQNEDVPVKVIFRARSPKIQVEQYNEPGEKPTIQRTRSEEEPHRVQHEVIRPVIQEIREVIQPYRRVIQEIQPVIEQVQTVVARGDGRTNNAQANEGLLLSQPLQLNNQDILNTEYGNANLGSLASLGLQASRSQLWSNAKALSRSGAASS